MQEIADHTVPLYVAAAQTPAGLATADALREAGFRFLDGAPDQGPPAAEEQPVAVLVEAPGVLAETWLRYVRNGASLVVIHPDPQNADRLGLRKGDGELVERPCGAGRVLVLTFSLGARVLQCRQRAGSVGLAFRGSPEAMLLEGVNRDDLGRPQLDILMGFLARFIVTETARHGRPVAWFGRMPRGYRSLVTFSFDDFCPSGKPVRRALNRLTSGAGIRRALADLVVETFRYPRNHQTDIRRLVTLFQRYRACATAFAIPFLGGLKNRPGLTGYRAFGLEPYRALRRAGWDVGTHLKPRNLRDYAVLRQRFEECFGVSPRGHRGHELGWVTGVQDWQALDELDYAYDSTWCWGGQAALSWILGTAYPFHPVDRDGKALRILEMPVTAWIEDLFETPEESLRAIVAGLETWPGLFHFGAHSWKTGDERYAAFIERILSWGHTRPEIGLDYNLAMLCAFWNARQASRLGAFRWDRDSRTVTFEVESHCLDDELTVCVPPAWNTLGLSSLNVNGMERPCTPGDGTASVRVGNGRSEIVVRYGDPTALRANRAK